MRTSPCSACHRSREKRNRVREKFLPIWTRFWLEKTLKIDPSSKWLSSRPRHCSTCCPRQFHCRVMILFRGFLEFPTNSLSTCRTIYRTFHYWPKVDYESPSEHMVLIKTAEAWKVYFNDATLVLRYANFYTHSLVFNFLGFYLFLILLMINWIEVELGKNYQGSCLLMSLVSV